MMPKSPRIWQLAERRYRLLGSKCMVCGKTSVGPRNVCPACGSEKIETVQLPSTGTVYSYTVVHILPAGKDGYGSYVMAIVELEDGTKLTAEIVDCDPEDVKIGMPVELAFRLIGQESEHGIIYYGYKFRPIIPQT